MVPPRDTGMERIPSIMSDVATLKQRVDDLTRRFEESEERQDERHHENKTALLGFGTSLRSIEDTLRDLGIAFKIGRYVMHILWGLFGGAAGIIISKWVTK
jgi:hypothetical protein